MQAYGLPIRSFPLSSALPVINIPAEYIYIYTSKSYAAHSLFNSINLWIRVYQVEATGTDFIYQHHLYTPSMYSMNMAITWKFLMQISYGRLVFVSNETKRDGP